MRQIKAKINETDKDNVLYYKCSGGYMNCTPLPKLIKLYVEIW